MASSPVNALCSYLTDVSKLARPHVREEAKLRIRRLFVELPIFVSHRSAYTNIYHCCLGRTGSQWLKRVLSDPRTFRRSGLRVYTYQNRLPGRIDSRHLDERVFESPFPPRRIVTPLYLSYENFQQVPKPDEYRAFFVYRDPRDAVVSGYFLRRNTATRGNTAEDQEYLQTASLEDGLLYMLDRLHRRGAFEAYRSWTFAREDEHVKLIRFEDLTGEGGFRQVQELFSFCDFALDEEELKGLLRVSSFDNLSGGRSRGQADQRSHYRKGTSGDWSEYFTPRVAARFNEAAGELLQAFGYEKTDDWIER